MGHILLHDDCSHWEINKFISTDLSVPVNRPTHIVEHAHNQTPGEREGPHLSGLCVYLRSVLIYQYQLTGLTHIVEHT